MRSALCACGWGPLSMMFLPLLSLAFGASPPNASSVHLRWQAPEATAFYNEMTVRTSVPGSYFMACGFSRGYFGIQQLPGTEGQVAIFSVWDPGSQHAMEADPDAVPTERRVRVHESGAGVRVDRFGNEGTGVRTLMDFPWKVDEVVRFFVRASAAQSGTVYSAYIQRQGMDDWLHMATLETQAGGALRSHARRLTHTWQRAAASVRGRERERRGKGEEE